MTILHESLIDLHQYYIKKYDRMIGKLLFGSASYYLVKYQLDRSLEAIIVFIQICILK